MPTARWPPPLELPTLPSVSPNPPHQGFRFDRLKIKGSLIVDLESLGARPEVQGRLGCFSTALLKKLPPFKNGVSYGCDVGLHSGAQKGYQ